MKNGFTLVELLAVIIILAVIATISTVAIGTIISNSKNNLSDTQKKTIEESAKTYYLKEGDLSLTSACVNLSYLLENGYIEASEIRDPNDEEIMDGSVLITYSANQYYYNYQDTICPETQNE